MKSKTFFIIMCLLSFLSCTKQDNPFFNYKQWDTPHGTYPFDKIQPKHFMPAFEQGLKEAYDEIDKIATNPSQPSFENTIVALDNAGDMLNCVISCFFNLSHSETNDSLQEIEKEISPKLSEYSSYILLNDKLFARVKKLYEEKESLHLETDQKKLLEDTYESFVNNGAELDEKDKATLRDLTAKLDMLTLTFGQNVLKATNDWTFLVSDEKDLKGLTDDTKLILKENAQKQQKSGWLLNLKPTTYIPFMQEADNRNLREKIYTAYQTRCIGGQFDNTANIINIANTRLAIANLLGKTNYAQKSLQKACAENQQNVMNFLDQLRDAYMPLAKKEVDEIQQFADEYNKKNGIKPFKIQQWDWAYFSEKLKKEKYEISDEILRPYFELEAVKQGVFQLANRLYDLTFKESHTIPVYHPEVTAYEVFDGNGDFIAVYYTDFHPRDGKRGGAWMNDFQPQFVYNGKDHRPHIVNVMNFTRPSQEKPALLTYYEVSTFLHEFGHALHGMLTKCHFRSQSGTNVPRDFVELPSQFNENFLNEKEFLDIFAKHYQTKEPMPENLIEKIKKSNTYHAAYACVRQLSFGYVDMAWHTLTHPFEVKNGDTIHSVIDFSNKAMSQVQVLPTVDNTQMITSFTHIFAGGYAAGYYSYKWSELLDADAFSVFQQTKKKNGSIFDREVADRFRTNILEKGGTDKPMNLYRAFRHGEPSIDALLIRDGLKKPQ